MENEFRRKVQIAAHLILNSRHFVAFTGAGISTESGLPDFRGPDGVWTRRDKGLPPKRMEVRWSDVEPNEGHRAIVALQDMGLLKFLISQNVDNLHLKSGISPGNIAELHGNMTLMKCLACGREFHKDRIWDERKWGKGYRTSREMPGAPRCNCGGRIVSSVVNFGDSLPERELDLSEDHAASTDVFMVVGSSLKVTPASEMPVVALNNGSMLIVINRMETPLDSRAHLRFSEDSGRVLTAIVDRIEELKC